MTIQTECPSGMVCEEGKTDTSLPFDEPNAIKKCDNANFCYRRTKIRKSTNAVTHSVAESFYMKKCWDQFNCGRGEKYIYGGGMCGKGFYCPVAPDTLF